jgi:hypothetical protein
MSINLKDFKRGMTRLQVLSKIKQNGVKHSEFDLDTDKGVVKAIDVIINDTQITLVFDTADKFTDYEI